MWTACGAGPDLHGRRLSAAAPAGARRRVASCCCCCCCLVFVRIGERRGAGGKKRDYICALSSHLTHSLIIIFSPLSTPKTQLGAARRVLAHLDGWVEAFIATLASGINGAPSAAANDEAVR